MQQDIQEVMKNMAKEYAKMVDPLVRIGIDLQKSMAIPSEVLKMLSSQINSVQAVMEDFDWQLEQIKEMHKKLSEPIEHALEAHRAFSERLKFSIDSGYLKDLATLSKRFKENNLAANSVFTEAGWWFAPSLAKEVDYNQVVEAIEEYKNNKNSIFNLIQTLFSEDDFEYLKSIVRDWFANKYFAPRRKIIEQAINAHIRGDYGVSIPTLISQAEGIAEAYCKANSIPYKRSDGKDKIIKSLKNNKKFSEIRNENLFLIYSEEKMFLDTNKLDLEQNKSQLNRHAILHGLSYSYDTEENSYRCILLLDLLAALK